MYTEEYESKGFPIRSFAIKLILVVIFVFLLIWLLPKFTSPTIETRECSTTGTCDTSGIEALTSQIFSDNLEKMKDAAISYYTDERLPKEVGQSETMTLSDMIGKKIIVALIDKNNKACDVEGSYVKITKLDDEYLLKVNLKDSEKEDYILVHLGCYTYCDSYICEKKTTNTSSSVPIKGGKVNPTVPIKGSIKDGVYYPPASSKPSSDTSCKGDNCNKPSDDNCKGDNCNKPSDDDCKGDNCNKPSNDNCKGDNCSTPKPSDKPCTGKECDNDETPSPTPSYQPKYIYEYKKTTSAKFSAWTSWSSWSKTSCSTQEVNCSDSSENCLYKLQMYKRKEQIGTYQKTYAKQREEVRQTGSYTEKSCNNFNYVRVNHTLYATTTTTTYTTVNTITNTTAHTVGSWKYVGRGSYSNPPRDSAGTSYKFVGADYSYCAETCTTLPNYYYDKYTYTGGLSSVSSSTTPGTTSSSSSSSTSSSTSTSYEASCGGYSYKTIPIYGTVTVTEKATRTEKLYGTVCYKSTKTRKLTNSSSTQTKWSSYDDKTLLNAGWTYTGRKKLK